MLNGSNDADKRKCVPFWLWLILLPIYGIKLSKKTILGVWIGIFSRTHKILKCSYYINYSIDHNQILQSDRDPQVLTVGCPNMPQTNSRWRTAAILKNWKILISSQPNFDKIWHADASPNSGRQQPIKFRDFKNPRWRRRPSWKFEKLQYLCNGMSDFDEIW